MKKITKNELDKILRKHKLWLMNDPEGEMADLSWADLSGANLSEANLSEADLSWADLSGANLYRANLSWANLYRANLYRANLSGANLPEANLPEADLSEANLYRANLSGANLYRANLSWAKNINYPIACPEKGSFIAFKKASGGFIVELEIPEDAKRCSATTRKCRCSKARVVSITNPDGTETEVTSVASKRDAGFVYKVGEVVEVPNFDENRWNECSSGIHFFITRQEAVDY